MKINASYTPVIAPQQRMQTVQSAQAAAERDEAESRLRDLIAQKHAEFDSFRPAEELGKHLDLRA